MSENYHIYQWDQILTAVKILAKNVLKEKAEKD